MAPFMESPGLKTSKHLSRYNLSDLPKHFTFVYDTGEDYTFNSTKLGTVDYDFRSSFVLLDAKGQGIWEDNHSTLYALLDGRLDPNAKEDEAKGYYLPWNFDNETFGDFFNLIDVNQINETLGKDFSKVLSIMRKNEKEYIEAHNISLKDLRPDYAMIKSLDQLREELNKDEEN